MVVIIRIIPVIHPLPEISGHIQGAIRTGSIWILPNFCGIPYILIVIRQGIVNFSTPRIGSPICAACRFLPFGFTRQPDSRPFTIGHCIVPIHIDDRVVVILRIAIVTTSGIRRCIRGRLAGSICHTAGIHSIGHFGLVDIVGIQGHDVDWFLICLTIITAHAELPSWHIHHQHLIHWAGPGGTDAQFRGGGGN